MPGALDETHDPRRRSWVQDANGHSEFPIQNLPFGVFRCGNGQARGGIAIGDHILSLRALEESGLLRGDALASCHAAAAETLNGFLSLGAPARRSLRKAVSELLTEGSPARPELLLSKTACELLLPCHIGDYTDFYAGIHHAENVGRLFRPDNPLLPNYKWVPIGYHGRSSSVRVSGEPVRRPSGQRKLPGENAPSFGPVRNLDFELELGIWVGPGNALGDAISLERAQDHIAGYCLLNDWSARDIQSWEYQPLGPFLAKNFHTTVSGWIVTPEALLPFRQPQPARPEDDPKPLPYLRSPDDQQAGALGVELEVFVTTTAMRAGGLAPHRISRSGTEHLYWTPAQLLAHHVSNGCNLAPGDLLGTGTISAPAPEGLGSLLEMTRGGAAPLILPTGEQRKFLEDGDEVAFRAHARREGFVSIGFGECRAVVTKANGATGGRA